MPQKHKKYDTTILAIFRPADPVRQLLRDYASACGHVLCCFDDLFDALSRIPIMDNPRTTVIAARPETLTAEAVAAFESLVNLKTVHYVLWLDGLGCLDHRLDPFRPANLHLIDTIHRFDAVLRNIEPAPLNPQKRQPDVPAAPSRRSVNLDAAPLSEEELHALLGAAL